MSSGYEDQVLQNLVERQVLSIEQANEVRQRVEETKDSDIRSVLAQEYGVSAEDYARSLAAVLQMPYVELNDYKISQDVLDVIPESTARGHSIIAYEDTGDTLRLAMADPSDRQIVEFIRKKVDKPIEVGITTVEAIRNTLSKYQATLEVELQELVEEARGTAYQEGDDLSKVAEDLPIIKITEAILKHAILQGASDIHIEPTEKQVIVRYRIDGILRDVLTLPKVVSAGLIARIKVLSNLKIDEHRLPQDGRFKMESDDYKVAFRVSTLPVFDGEKIVMRLLDESGQGLGLDDIGMSERSLDIFRRNITKPNGMVLVTGPTGSGKTTTLYAAMREMNTPKVNISTIEDPVEYRMPRINQTQVQPKIGLSFSTGLRALVRQDPDIIMVGEIRDEETAALAVNASLTGHLVLSTLHTNSAAGAIPRLLDMAVEPFLIASTANILLAQRLVRRLCTKCREEGTFDSKILDSLEVVMDTETLLDTLQRAGVVEEGANWNDITLYQPNSCEACTGGYKGRIGIYEVLEVTEEIQQLITSNVTSQKLEDTAREQQGMVTMLEDGIIKVVNGITSVEEVLRVAKE